MKNPQNLKKILFLILLLFSSNYTISKDLEYIIKKINFRQVGIIDTLNNPKHFFDLSILNKLHIDTDVQIIKRELLFKENDTLNQNLIYESERNLRKLNYIGDIFIHQDTLEKKDVIITVNTKEKWTTNLNSSFKQEGGLKSFWMSLEESNLFGKGQLLRFNYTYNNKWSNPHGFNFDFRENRLFGSRWSGLFKIRKTEEINLNVINIDRPFYAEKTKWCMGVYEEWGKTGRFIYDNSKLINKIYTSNNVFKYYFTRFYGNQIKFFPTITYLRTRKKNKHNVKPNISDNLDLVQFSLGFMKRKFYKGMYLNNFGRIEDVSSGYFGNMLIGKNFKFTLKSNADYYFRFDWNHSFGIIENYYFNYNFNYSAFVTGQSLINKVFEVNNIQHLVLPYKNVLALRSSLVLSNNWLEYIKLNLGGRSGLRGYSAYKFNGSNKLLFNIENRFYPSFNFWIFKLGGALFFDVGAVSENYKSLLRQKYHASVGFGLRIENSIQKGNDLIRIDFAYNLDNNKFAEIIISSDHLFSAFSDISFFSPNIPDLE